jgi:hypothetical protein
MCHQTTRQCTTRSDDNEYNPSVSRARARSFHSYHRECNGNSFDWDGVEVLIEGNPDIVLVLEPRKIDNFLDNGMSIWISWTLAKVEILQPYNGVQLTTRGDVMRRTR